MPREIETYRMSCATQRWMTAAVSRAVRAPATMACTLDDSSGGRAYRSWANPPYQRPMSSQVSGEETATDM